MGVNVPIIFLGQRLHEADLPAFLLEGGDGSKWQNVILKSMDDAGNALYPEAFPKEMLLKLQEFSPYVFASQHQQDPIPAGGALFKPKYFPILSEEPEMLMTFIVADTAETTKEYNDATVFSFFGLYKATYGEKQLEDYYLQWIDCVELRIEPKDLKSSFMDFWADCMRHKCPPRKAYIEKRSTGSTLLSVLDDIRGLEVVDIKRPRNKEQRFLSKTQRMLDIQPFIYAQMVSFLEDAAHINMCVTHMSKITANESHRFDDIADTLADACRIAFIDKTLYFEDKSQVNEVGAKFSQDFNRKLNMVRNANRGYR